MKYLAVLLLLTGCAHESEPQAPIVMTEPLALECPQATPRIPDAGLLASLNVDPPALRDAPDDDYLISRPDAERTVTALRACSTRIDDWKAWAAPDVHAH